MIENDAIIVTAENFSVVAKKTFPKCQFIQQV
ncbi:hypothetical protein BCF50_0652 [Chryseobacterium daecheongense]|uniref:Uncharacterized protein n=1 Tax=Chryseobacterium daecheongense TaxID=192389 RepID=A0ABY2FYM6_9FLAO|nr:hypothetical protein BCF50_0652 [Chryseobacterium daecheongense]